jgi:chorismate mutase/prephenate dehydratase
MTLEELRKKIDAIDTEMLRLLNERADVVHEVGVLKKREGLAIYAPEREDALLKSLIAKSEGRLPEKSIRAIYREIMSAALALEEDLKIAYLGPPGTWTHQASISKFGHSVAYLPQPNLADVFDHVTRGLADYGVVPIENSTEGAVRDIFQLFADHSLQICAEVCLPIEICLLSAVPMESVGRIYGHPAIIAAARRWFAKQSRDWKFVEVATSASAAEKAVEDPVGAAVGSFLIAELHGLQPIARQIQDDKTVGRFSVVGHRPSPPTNHDQTLLTVSGEEVGRCLVDTLAVFDSFGIETIRIDGHEIAGAGPESRALIRIEVAGHADVPPVSTAIGTLIGAGKVVTTLGSFPRSQPIEF